MSSFFPPVGSSHARKFQIFPPVGASQAREFKYFRIPLLSPQTLENTVIYGVFSIFPCSNAAGQLKHKYKKSFQNIVFHSVFTMLPVKNTVIHMFLALKSVQNTSFQCTDINFFSMYYFMFFHFWLFFHCQKPAKMTQHSIRILPK